MDDFFVLLLRFEDKMISVFEMFHIIYEYFKVKSNILLKRIQYFNIGLF